MLHRAEAVQTHAAAVMLHRRQDSPRAEVVHRDDGRRQEDTVSAQMRGSESHR